MSRPRYGLLICALWMLFALPGLGEAGASGGALFLVRCREPVLEARGLDAEDRVVPLRAVSHSGEIVTEYVHTGSVLMSLTESRRQELMGDDDLVVVPADVKMVAVPPLEGGSLSADGPADSWHMALVRDLRNSWPVAAVELDDVKVAFMDTGVRSDHPDLAGSLIGPLAYNATGDGAVGLSHVEDDNGHGTSVAGIIVGEHTGVSSHLDLVPVKFADSHGEANLTDFERGLNHLLAAMDSEGSALYGRRLVVNVSYSTAPGTAGNEAIGDYFRSLFDSLRDVPVLFVFAGGNDGVDVGDRFVYPPCLEAPNLVAVAASTREGGLASTFSNYGRGEMEVAAPGEGILTTSRGTEGYSTVYGTSFAAPFVTGVAAWVWAANPEWDPTQVRNVLLNLVPDPFWTEDHHLASTTYTVPVLSAGAISFEVLDGGQAFLDDAAGSVARALDVRVPPGEQEDLPGSGDEGDDSLMDKVTGGGCLVGVCRLWMLLPAICLLLRSRS